MPLVEQIERIRAYTRTHPELLRSHHFVYDLPLAQSPGGYRFLVMGVNPGERLSDWEQWPQPSEETSLFDFHAAAAVRGAGSKRWRTLVEQFCGTPYVLMSEFFLWSSPNTHRAFVERFGLPIEKSPHLRFCLEANLELIRSYEVEVVVAPGLKCLDLFGDAYGLRHVRTINADNGHALIKHYERGGTPWLFTKHWTASFGFSKAQKERVREYIAEVSSK